MANDIISEGRLAKIGTVGYVENPDGIFIDVRIFILSTVNKVGFQKVSYRGHSFGDVG